MARTAITLFTPNIPYPVLPVTALSADLSMQALSGSAGANGNQAAFGNFSSLMLIFQNTSGGALTVTITSFVTPNAYNRSGDVTAYAMAAAAISVFVIPRNGFVQADGNVYFEASGAAVKCCVIGIN